MSTAGFIVVYIAIYLFVWGFVWGFVAPAHDYPNSDFAIGFMWPVYLIKSFWNAMKFFIKSFWKAISTW